MHQKKKEKTVFKLSQETELTRLGQELDYNNSDANLDNYNFMKHELEQIEISETYRHIFRSNIKWTED